MMEQDIVLHEVSKAFGAQTVLHKVSHCFAHGQTTCVMAPSGAGKTTLVQLIMGLLQPDGGSITGTQGVRFACAFQEDRLAVQLSAPANVRFACGAVHAQTLQAAFAAVGLGEEDLHKPVAQLSGGQRRRVALVRAMLARADVVILDEPFKGLDDAARAAAAQFVKAQKQGRTLLVITHDETDAAALKANIFFLTNAP